MAHIGEKRAPGTAREYQGHFDKYLLPALGNDALDKINTSALERLHIRLKAKKVLANRAIATLSSLYGWAQFKNVPYGFNPFAKVEMYKEEAKERLITDKELKGLGAALTRLEEEGRISKPALGAVRLLLLTGCRRDEIRLAQWQHIDWQRRTLYLPKAKRGRRYVHLNDLAIEILQSLANAAGAHANPYVVAGTLPGEPYKNLQDVWGRVRELADLKDARLHDLRHTLASLAGAEGASLPIIAALLGNTPAAARRYTHLAGDPAKRAAQQVGERLGNILKA